MQHVVMGIPGPFQSTFLNPTMADIEKATPATEEEEEEEGSSDEEGEKQAGPAMAGLLQVTEVFQVFPSFNAHYRRKKRESPVE